MTKEPKGGCTEQKFNPDSPEPKTFGELLRRTRRQAGKTMGDIARELPWLPVTKLSAIEVGDEPPPGLLVVKELAEVIMVDPQPWLRSTTQNRLLSMAERERKEWKARQQVPAPLPAAGPWRYDEPPKEKVIVALMREYSTLEKKEYRFYEVLRWLKGNINSGWATNNSRIYQSEAIICWAEINMPEGKNEAR
jgi:hypothetical protein